MAQWRKDSEAAEAEGAPVPQRGCPRIRAAIPRCPSGLFNGMITPLTPYAIRGVIWYQGESNSDRPFQYRKLFPAMIGDWRQAWGEGDFPFLYVQLAELGCAHR